MPAPRKFSDAQRQALWRLGEAGMTSAEIAKAAEEGATGLARFTISSRTVRDIIAKMSMEAERKLPATVLDLEHGEAMERAPARAARILEAELDRLEAKVAKQPLTDKEIDRLPKLATYATRIAKLLEGRTRQRARRAPAREHAEEDREPGWAIRQLAREEEEEKEAEDQLAAAHAPPGTADPEPAPADSGPGEDDDLRPVAAEATSEDVASTARPYAGEVPTVDATKRAVKRAIEERSYAERVEAARKARAALASTSA